MALDIYLSSNKNQSIASIESTSSIQRELVILEQQTGVIIDEYGTTNLYLDHIKLMNNLLDDKNEWSMVFNEAIDSNSGLIILGD